MIESILAIVTLSSLFLTGFLAQKFIKHSRELTELALHDHRKKLDQVMTPRKDKSQPQQAFIASEFSGNRRMRATNARD